MPPKRNKWSHRAERRAEDRRREEIVEVAVALATAHAGEEVGQTMGKLVDEVRAAWLALDAAERQVEGARHERGTMQQRAIKAERQLREAQEQLAAAQAATARVAELETQVRLLQALHAEAHAETRRAQQARPAAGPVLGSATAARVAAMPVAEAWHLLRCQAALRSTVAMMRQELLARHDALEVRQLCTLLTVAAEGSARAAAVEDLRAALVILRSRAATDSLGKALGGGPQSSAS